MSLRNLALKPGELKALSRSGLLLFAARCALRVEPCLRLWWPDPPAGIRTTWTRNLDFLVAAASTPRVPRVAARSRSLSNAGAQAGRRFDSKDETRGRCLNYVFLTLSAGVETAALVDRAAAVKSTILTAKYSASIPAILAHAGRITTPGDPVDTACGIVWNAIRVDVKLLGGEPPAMDLPALRRIAPFWPDPAPSWW